VCCVCVVVCLSFCVVVCVCVHASVHVLLNTTAGAVGVQDSRVRKRACHTHSTRTCLSHTLHTYGPTTSSAIACLRNLKKKKLSHSLARKHTHVYTRSHTNTHTCTHSHTHTQANDIISNRLFEEIREKRGLVYSIGYR